MTVEAKSEVERAATFLFVPGTRIDRFDKAVASGADIVILDLEDAVAAADKSVARDRIRSWLAAGGRAAVRVNPVGSPWFRQDMAAIAAASAVVLPKAESVGDVEQVAERAAGLPIVPLIESARGMAATPELCAGPGVARLGFGNVDFAAEIGVDPACHAALVTARSTLVYASSAAGLAAPVDGVTTDLSSPVTLRDDANHARMLGFTAKLLIHPSQVAPAAQAIRPTPEELNWARGVLDATSASVAVYEGHMVDEPVLLRARRVLERANAHRPDTRSSPRG